MSRGRTSGSSRCLSDRVLLLSHCFPPTALPESLLSAKRMGSLPGFEVDVVCPDWRPGVAVDHSLDAYVVDRFGRVTRVGRSPVWRLVRFGRFAPLVRPPDVYRLLNGPTRRAAARALRSRQYGAIVTWSQMHSIHLVGRSLRRRFGVPWLAHFSDPWVDNPFVEPTALERRLHERLERSVVEAADRLLFTSDETVELVMEKYPRQWRRKVHVLPHAFDPSLYPPVRAAVPRERLMFRYLGAFYGPRSPQPLVAALELIGRDDPDLLHRLRVEIVGRVEERMLDGTSLGDSLTVRPHVDYVRSLELMTGADGLLVVDAPADASPFLPSKLVDYVGSGRPIAALTPEGPAARLVRRLGGPVAHPSDTPGAAGALRRLVELADGGEAFGSEDARRDYSTERVGEQMAEIIRATASID